MTKKSRPIPLVFLLSFLALPLLSQGVAVHKVPEPYSSGVPLKIVVETEALCQWAALFFRAEGEENFRSLPLTKGRGNPSPYPRDLYVSREEAGVLLRPEGAVEVVSPPEQAPETLFRLIGGGSPDRTSGRPSRSSSPGGTESPPGLARAGTPL